MGAAHLPCQSIVLDPRENAAPIRAEELNHPGRAKAALRIAYHHPLTSPVCCIRKFGRESAWPAIEQESVKLRD
jgi:hypothetical protein